MKKLVILLTVLSSWMYASAEEYTLDGIQQLARANYPAIRQFELIDKIADFSLADASSAWAPQISLSGQATYQSDVVSFPESMTDVFSMLGVDISGLHKDQYKLALNIEQTLWDGGYTKSRKEAVLAEKEVSSKSVEVELYALADKVNQLYFGILVLDEQLRLNDLASGILEDNRKIIRSYIDNGLAGQGRGRAHRQLTAEDQDLLLQESLYTGAVSHDRQGTFGRRYFYQARAGTVQRWSAEQ